MYLVQARRLRRRRSPGQGVQLLSLERLEAMNRRAIIAGLPAADRRPARRPRPAAAQRRPVGEAGPTRKSSAPLGLWLVFAILLYLRYGAARPRPAAGPADDRRLRPAARRAGVAAHPFVQGVAPMNLLAVGCSYRTRPVEVREQLAFDGAELPPRPATSWRAATAARRSSSAPATASSCTSPGPTPTVAPDADLIAEFLAEFHGLPADERPAAPVRAPRRRRGAAPVPRRRQPRQPDRRRGADRRAGEAGLRAGPASAAPPGRCCTPCSSTRRASPSASAPRPASPAATSRSPAPRSITSARCSTTSTTRRSWSSAPARWAS